jgi:aminotransferase
VNRLLQDLAPHSSKRISEYAQSHSGVLDLTVGLPSFGPPRAFGDALSALARPLRASALPYDRYAHSRGAPELRDAIASVYASEQGVDLDPATTLLITNGAAGALWTGLLAVTEPGDEIMISDPCYMIYPPMIELLGRRPVRVPTDQTDGFALRPSRIQEALTQRSRVVLVNSPGNPTGAVHDEADLATLCDFAEKHGLFVMQDEVLDRYCFRGRHRSVVAVDRHGVGIAVNSLSKRFGMAGWRIGWLAGASQVVEQAAKAHTHFLLAVNHAVQLAAATALSDAGVDAEVSRHANELHDRGLRFLSALREVPGLSVPSRLDGGFYAFVGVRDFALLHHLVPDDGQTTGEAVAEHMLHKRGVAVVPGSAFGNAGADYVRMSFAGDPQQLDDAVCKLQSN